MTACDVVGLWLGEPRGREPLVRGCGRRKRLVGDHRVGEGASRSGVPLVGAGALLCLFLPFGACGVTGDGAYERSHGRGHHPDHGWDDLSWVLRIAEEHDGEREGQKDSPDSDYRDPVREFILRNGGFVR